MKNKHSILPATFFTTLKRAMVSSMLVMVCTMTSQAQLSNLDDARFIKGLADRNMPDLLLHFLESADIKDPVMLAEIKISQAKLVFGNPNLNEQQQAEGPIVVIDGYRKLIKDNPTHYKRLQWKVELAEYILLTVLPLRYRQADSFYEFGVAGGEQKEQYETLVAEMVAMLKTAREDWFILQGDLPRRADFEFKFVNTGEWRRIRDEIAKLKLPFYSAWMGYYGLNHDKR